MSLVEVYDEELAYIKLSSEPCYITTLSIYYYSKFNLIVVVDRECIHPRPEVEPSISSGRSNSTTKVVYTTSHQRRLDVVSLVKHQESGRTHFPLPHSIGGWLVLIQLQPAKTGVWSQLNQQKLAWHREIEPSSQLLLYSLYKENFAFELVGKVAGRYCWTT